MVGNVASEVGWVARVKAVEFWAGERAAREVAVAKLLRDHAHSFRTPEWTERLPGYSQFLEDVRSLSEQFGIRPPEVKVMAGYGSLTRSGMAVLTDRLLLVNEEALFVYSPDQLKAITAHELSHIVNGDLDRIPSLFPTTRSQNHKREFAADAKAVSVTNDSESLASVFAMSQNEASHSHPSSRVRIQKLSEVRPKAHVDRLKCGTVDPKRGRE